MCKEPGKSMRGTTMKRLLSILFVMTLILSIYAVSYASGTYMTSFNNRYGTTGTAIGTCSVCHTTAPACNSYGNAFKNNARNYATIEPIDSDGDGFTNIVEINARTFPGNSTSHPAAGDTTPPTVMGFSIPSTVISLTVSITSFIATDNVGVTGYLVTETTAKPSASSAGWSTSAPTSYTFASAGTKTLHAWAKDAAGNVSASLSASVTITIQTAISVTAPNGGELIPSGSTYAIRWSASLGIVKFDIGYSLGDGAQGTWKLIASNITGYSYNWTIPAPDGNNNKCRVGVRGYDAVGAVAGTDTSDNPFTIEVVKVTYPNNAGEILLSGNTYRITWQTNGTVRYVHSVKIYGSLNDQFGTWRLLATIPGNPGYYDWTVPPVSTTKNKCRIGIRLLDSISTNIGQDMSEGNFTIQP